MPVPTSERDHPAARTAAPKILVQLPTEQGASQCADVNDHRDDPENVGLGRSVSKSERGVRPAEVGNQQRKAKGEANSDGCTEADAERNVDQGRRGECC